ncbi:VWA domain-containing protein [Streptosporangium saharense]|uniref:VWA domain-containing protein n=1 Tax=Streptosporangium saharense TaxID=1706840 RepID=UPI0034226E76
MSRRPAFTLEVGQNKYLRATADEMHAMLTIGAHGLDGLAPTVAEVILVDTSGSMGRPGTKIGAARRASAAAIDTLRDGAFFAVVSGNHEATMVYPPVPGLAVATPEVRQEAKAAVRRLTERGGTAMSTWLRLARRVLATRPAVIRHAILLTDGRNESEPAERLDAELDACEAFLSCDARGIGDGWASQELLRVVTRLNGTADAVRDDADLVADFRELTRSAMRRGVPDLRVRLRLLPGAEVRYVKQVFPVEADLTERLVRSGDVVEFGTGPWGEESREYFVCVAVDPTGRDRGEDLRLARVDLETAEGTSVDVELPAVGTPILVHWTDEPVLSSRIDPKVGHHSRHLALREAIDAGRLAYESGDRAGAERAWGRAVRLATELGNARNLTWLSHLVHVVDASRGRVRLRERIDPRDMKGSQLSSWHSTLSPGTRSRRPGEGVEERLVAGGRRCLNCSRVPRAESRFCEQCGLPLTDLPPTALPSEALSSEAPSAEASSSEAVTEETVSFEALLEAPSKASPSDARLSDAVSKTPPSDALPPEAVPDAPSSEVPSNLRSPEDASRDAPPPEEG